jgi:hypothetical protein
LYGDSIASLRTVRDPVDLFINDSDHPPDYELLEYQTIEPKLSAQAIVLGDNANVTTALMLWSEKAERQFLFGKKNPWAIGTRAEASESPSLRKNRKTMRR